MSNFYLFEFDGNLIMFCKSKLSYHCDWFKGDAQTSRLDETSRLVTVDDETSRLVNVDDETSRLVNVELLRRKKRVGFQRASTRALPE